VTNPADGVDVRRRAGWLPEGQDELESWLSGHRRRVQAKGERVTLYPVIAEFRELIDSGPAAEAAAREAGFLVNART
jgi:phosphatidylserine decarboxylase